MWALHRHSIAFFDFRIIRLLVCATGVIHVVTAQSVAPRRTIMTTFTIDTDNNITAFGSAEEAAANRIWARIQGLGEAAKPEAKPAKPKAAKKAKAGAQAAKGAPTKGKATKKTTPAKNAPKSKKPAKAQESAGPREGSKTAQVVAMLQRKNGATLAEIMDKMGWRKHTVRGFMAGAMKKAGYTVESFKSDKGERTYRINQ
jgi:hypothetical protein